MIFDNKTILVTGGAGYIGSHFLHQLTKVGGSVVVLDNFGQSKKNIIDHPSLSYVEADVRDIEAVRNIMKSNSFDAVVHFAALASVPDSVIHPEEYYTNNIIGGLNILKCMREQGVGRIVFSSSASVYGEPLTEVITESHQKDPMNPYGYTKLVFENFLKQYSVAYGLQSISFRYFCACGNDESGNIGEFHNPETHVIPALLETALGRRKEFFVYGNDFLTPDGTGIRDYIHVNDLARAHIAGLQKLFAGKNICAQYNLGINKGFSVMELIQAVEKVSGKKISYSICGRRPGDPSFLIADASKARHELGWEPRYLDIEEIIKTTYNFYQKNA